MEALRACSGLVKFVTVITLFYVPLHSGNILLFSDTDILWFKRYTLTLQHVLLRNLSSDELLHLLSDFGLDDAGWANCLATATTSQTQQHPIFNIHCDQLG